MAVDLEFKGTIQRLLGRAYEIKKALGRTLVNNKWEKEEVKKIMQKIETGLQTKENGVAKLLVIFAHVYYVAACN